MHNETPLINTLNSHTNKINIDIGINDEGREGGKFDHEPLLLYSESTQEIHKTSSVPFKYYSKQLILYFEHFIFRTPPTDVIENIIIIKSPRQILQIFTAVCT